jgi:hypothetical protein
MLGKQGLRACIGFMWLREYGPVASCYEHYNEPLGSSKDGYFLSIKSPLASQEGLYFTELVIFLFIQI